MASARRKASRIIDINRGSGWRLGPLGFRWTSSPLKCRLSYKTPHGSQAYIPLSHRTFQPPAQAAGTWPDRPLRPAHPLCRTPVEFREWFWLIRGRLLTRRQAPVAKFSSRVSISCAFTTSASGAAAQRVTLPRLLPESSLGCSRPGESERNTS